MANLRRSYHLNGIETQQIWMAALKGDSHLVKGNWNPMNGNAILQPDTMPLVIQVTGLQDRIRAKFQKRANYTEIGRTKQKDDESLDDFIVRMTKVFKANSGLHDDEQENGEKCDSCRVPGKNQTMG